MFDTRALQPNETFDWAQVDGRQALRCAALQPHADHLFTTRNWRLGQADPGQSRRGWDEVAAAMGVEAGQLMRVRQVHGANVAIRRRGGASIDLDTAADIILSNDPSVAIAVQAADCVPILIADRRTGVVAAAHAGWRGLTANVPGVTVAALVEAFGVAPADLVASIGPSVRACCYEVGDEVYQRFAETYADRVLASWFFPSPQPSPVNESMPGLPLQTRPGHRYFDSSAAARHQLTMAGVPKEAIRMVGWCTASHPATLCSFRRDGAAAGRMVAAIRASVAR